MDTQNKGIVEKIVDAITPTSNVKGDDYFKIWESWGMTKEQWAEVESKRAKTPKTTMHTEDGTLIGEVTSIKGA